MSQPSINFTYDVSASLFTTLISKVVTVNITVRFTVIAVLKKFGSLKKEVALLIAMRRREGKKVMRDSWVSRLLKMIFISTSPSSPWTIVGDFGWSVMKYSVSSFSVDIRASPSSSLTLSWSVSSTARMMKQTCFNSMI